MALDIAESFRVRYGSEPRLFRAPGRVNLIGEHTDYNDGYVLPMAIQQGTTVAAARRPDRVVRVYSANLDEDTEFDLDRPGTPQRKLWTDYVEGVGQALLNRAPALSGADLLVLSDLAIGGGLSSSAALEMSVGLALLTVSGIDLDRVALALAGQEAEHRYVGINSGIMDQFVAVLGKAGNALLIDCRNLKGDLVRMSLGDSTIVICDTKVKHKLAASEYNERRAECERGVTLLSKAMPGIRALRDVSPAQFDRYKDRLPDPVRRRCLHVVTENERTLLAARALAAGDVKKMGLLMFESHESLRQNYEVSCPELDVLVEAAAGVPGVWGARMTGGGFGGCTVNLVLSVALDEFRRTVIEKYHGAFGVEPGIFVAESSDGAREISNRG
jgi:galactokinase